MKKILTVLLTFILTLNCFSTLAIAETKATGELSEAEKFCMGVGIYSSDNYSSEQYISRGKFAEILCNICMLPTIEVETAIWTDFVDGNDNLTSDELLFNDVDISYPDYPYIKAVVDAGYMNGISENLFGADINLTTYQAYRVFLDMAGYKTLASMSGGYMACASKIGASKGVSSGENDYLTFSALAKIIYNLLDVKVMDTEFNSAENISYKQAESETFLNHVFNMKKVRGTIVDNGYTAFDGKSSINNDSVKVGNVTVKVSKDTEYIRDCLGREVDLYYRFDWKDEDENEAVYAVLNDRRTYYTFDVNDFISYDGKSISFNAENQKQKNVTLSDIQYMVYNNEALTVFNESIFDFYSGKICVIPTIDGSKSLIIINACEYCYVSSLSKNDEIICNKINNQNISDRIELKNYEDYEIKESTGELKTLSDIKTGDVLKVIKNSNRISIYIIRNTVVDFIIKGTTVDDNNRTIINNENGSYKISKQLEEAQNCPVFTLAKSFNLYLSDDNEVIWAEIKGISADVGFLIKATPDDEIETVMHLKISDMEGNIKRLETTDKYSIDCSDGVKRKIQSTAQAENLLKDVNEIIRYKLDSDGKITYIELPLTSLPAPDNRLYKIVDTSNITGTYPYYWQGDFGFAIGYGTDVKILYVPNDYSEESKFRAAASATEMFDGKYQSRPFIAYSLHNCDYYADYIIAKQKVGETVELKNAREFLAVTDIYEELNDNDEIINVIKGCLVYGEKTNATVVNKTFYVKPDEKEAIEEMTDIYKSTDDRGNINHYSLKSGDIIRLLYDEYNYIQAAELIYRPSMINPSTGKKGTIAGSIGYWDKNSELSNPMCMDNNANLKKLTTKDMILFDFSLGLSWITDRIDSTFRFTTQNLSTGDKFLEDGGGKYLVQVKNMPAMSKLIYLEYNNGKLVTARAAESSDVKTYDDYGSNCSMLLHNWYWGTGLHGFIINNN